MEYKKTKPAPELAPFINFYWELVGNEHGPQWERVFPDGCAGVLINLGSDCLTDNGSLSMSYGKTYAVGAMRSFKDSLIDHDCYLIGASFKPAALTNFYEFDSQQILTNETIEFERACSFKLDRLRDQPHDYLNRFFLDRMKQPSNPMQAIINDIDVSNGHIRVQDLSKRHFTTVRQVERYFKRNIGLTPKEYSNIIRFQNAMRLIKESRLERSLSEIAFTCGYYDHAHLTNDIKRHTGMAPSQL